MSVEVTNTSFDSSGPVELDELQFDFLGVNCDNQDNSSSHQQELNIEGDNHDNGDNPALNFLIPHDKIVLEENEQKCNDLLDTKAFAINQDYSIPTPFNQDLIDKKEIQCLKNEVIERMESELENENEKLEIEIEDGSMVTEDKDNRDRLYVVKNTADESISDLKDGLMDKNFCAGVQENIPVENSTEIPNVGVSWTVPDKKDENNKFQNPLQESVRSLTDVFIESIPENTQQASPPLQKDRAESDSEFEDEYEEQDLVSKDDSESDSEFEIPDIPKQNIGKSVTFTPQDKGLVTMVTTAMSAAAHVAPDTSKETCPEQPKFLSDQPNTLMPQMTSGLPTISKRLESDESQAPVSSSEEKEKDSRVTTTDDWENVTTIQAEFADNRVADRGEAPAQVSPLLSSSEAVRHFRAADLSAVKPNVRTSLSRHGLSAITHFLFGPPKMHRDLQDDRELVFLIAGSQLNNEDKVHVGMLQSIYRILTGSRFDCQRFGNHWEEIGFQGRDPSTDIRGVGMLGLLQLLHFLRDPRSAQLARDVYKLSLHPTQNFPFCVMGINISRICLQSLREDIMNKECNRRRQVFEVVNEFYVGTYLQLYKIWKHGKTITDSGHVLKEVETFAKKNARSVLRNLEEHVKQKAGNTADLGTEEGQEFLSVCKTEPGE